MGEKVGRGRRGEGGGGGVPRLLRRWTISLEGEPTPMKKMDVESLGLVGESFLLTSSHCE